MTFHVLGDEDVVAGFQFAGISGTIVKNTHEGRTLFYEILKQDIGILIITEKISVLIQEDIIKHQLSGNYPLIVEIPDMNGHLSNKETLLQSIRKAIGISV